MSSNSFFGWFAGNGEATCSTYLQPATASGQPASDMRSAAANESASPGSAPPVSSIARTSASRSTERTVARTR